MAQNFKYWTKHYFAKYLNINFKMTFNMISFLKDLNVKSIFSFHNLSVFEIRWINRALPFKAKYCRCGALKIEIAYFHGGLLQPPKASNLTWDYTQLLHKCIFKLLHWQHCVYVIWLHLPLLTNQASLVFPHTPLADSLVLSFWRRGYATRNPICHPMAGAQNYAWHS